MILDSEQQKTNLLQVIDACPINGPLGQSVQIVSALMQLRQQVQDATIGVFDAPETPGVPAT
jgi:hypothetical protein